MSTTPINNYRLNHKLHPLSLLAQLTSRHATGCLRVFTDTTSWTINLEAGKLTYASYSDKLFERFDNQLRRLSQKIPTLNSATRVQMRLMFEPKGEDQSMLYADYQAICWLVNQNHINPKQAAILIEELAKEVIETFLVIKQGSYEFFPDILWEEMPKFCYLDLRLLVEYCQKQLRQRQPTPPSVNTGGGSQVLPSTRPASSPSSNQNHPENSVNSQPINPPSLVRKTLYTIACIDDSQTVLNSIRSFLDENVFTVVTINDPVKALMQVLRSKPDLILLDVTMPNLDGYELCSLLRRHSAFKNTPIIMVTGRTGFVDRAKAKMVRSSGYLTKPFDQSELLKMVFKHIT
ncbi:response regulator [Anabaena sp. FACHB-709]|uniref:Protein PatA n=2 Tax=Nostocaceae TaxID=1162 RepID=A0A1Z4KFS1_ANAVA|nr:MULTISPECIES: response regulator [Nostocaceae]BAY67787.1 two-component response regulator [Trichormus variabilis NIES-23]HBW29538.1 response regulator [Nostoc sp. UBA8866]MBD2170121.1 response regulator [Anabaena cylindrica FACHB-318]MBD2261458.1 response regulator [Anabaena sp. FACHB-709]MBD2271042.1 response regulator [Nostoc sp. PCC 7120 = FACHB-418]